MHIVSSKDYIDKWYHIQSLINMIKNRKISSQFHLQKFKSDDDLNTVIIDHYSEKLEELRVSPDETEIPSAKFEKLKTLENTILGMFAIHEQ